MTAVPLPNSRPPRRGVNWEKWGWLYMRVSGVLLVVLIFGHLLVNLFLGEGVSLRFAELGAAGLDVHRDSEVVTALAWARRVVARGASLGSISEVVGAAAAGYIPDARVQIDNARFFSQSRKAKTCRKAGDWIKTVP